MKIELAPIDYYFYRPNLYTIQFAFEYQNKISMAELSKGIKNLLTQMPVVGSRLQKVSNSEIVLKIGYEIPIREQQLENESVDEPDDLFDSVCNVEDEPLVKILISHTRQHSYVGISFSHMLGDGVASNGLLVKFKKSAPEEHLFRLL